MAFETLPSRLGPIEQFHPMPVAPPPIYDTSQTIHQLQALAEYFSPDARAKRQAAVAKARWEWQVYNSKNPAAAMDPMWAHKLRKTQLDEQLTQAKIDYLRKRGMKPEPDPGKRGSDIIFGTSHASSRPVTNASNPMNLRQDDIDQTKEAMQDEDLTGLDMSSSSTPPPVTE